jgi:LPXTG-motif cell wall-anchored protein
MKSPRTLAVALCTLAIAVFPAHALAQSGAGDDQYQDPFAGQNDGGGSNTGGGSDSGGGTSNSGGGTSDSGGSSGTAADTGDAGLSTAPPDSSLTTPPPIDSTGTTASQATLPNTGVDTRLLVGAGIALLLMGIGLRLRTADERRF